MEAITRLFKPEEIESPDLMMYTGLLGLLINLVGLFIFGHGHSHSGPSNEVDDDDSDSEDESDKIIDNPSNGFEKESHIYKGNKEDHSLVNKAQNAKVDIKMDKKTASKTPKKKACCAILCK